MATDLLGMRTSGATLVGILGSRTVQDDLINQFDLRKVYSKSKYESTRKVLQAHHHRRRSQERHHHHPGAGPQPGARRRDGRRICE